jgi:MscS family membrane protein
MEQSEFISGYLSSIGLDSWVVQVFAVVFITLLVNFFQRRTMKRLEKTLKRSPTIWDGVVINALRRPLGVLIWVIGLAFAIEIIQRDAGATIFEAVEPIRDLGIIANMAWFMVRLIKNIEINLIAERQRKGVPIDKTTLDAIAKLLRLSVLITATLVALQTLGFSISGVLAFGGIGGIAVGFAAKDLLANFFGGLMVYLDRPFAVGDWVRSPDQEIEGTVENIGWRQTRIRTFDSRPLYVPNSTFTSISVENPSRMQNRRIYEVVGIRYDDADNMSGVVKDVAAMLRTHPEIAADLTLMVNFNAFAPSSLDFFIYCFTKTTGWVKYHEIKQDVLLKILAIIKAHGAEVAFPTSTIHIPNGLPPAQPVVQS